MLAVTSADSSKMAFHLSVTPEKSAELTEIDGVRPAHYVARYLWVTVERSDAIGVDELKELINNSYNLVRNKLPKEFRDSPA